MAVKMDQFSTNNPNPLLSVEKDGTVLYSNKAGELLLHEWDIEVGEKLPSNIVELVQRVISWNSPEKIEVIVGKSVYLVVFHPLPIQGCVNISGFDTSDKKKLEEKPLKSEDKYQELFNLVEQAIQIGEIVFDEKCQPIDNIILYVNLAYEKLLGLRQEEIIGRSLKEIFPVVDQIWLDHCGEAVRTGMTVYFEEYNASLDRWFEVFASPMEGNRFIAVFSDITKHKQTEEDLLQSEQHYRLLHETMLQGVVYQDASGKIISMNPAAERILGKTPDELLGSYSIGKEHLTIRENGSPFPGLEHPAMVSLRTGQKVQNVVMGVYNPREDCYRWINVNAVPIFRTGQGKPFQVYTLFDDITQRKQKEHSIYRYNRILEGINRIFSSVVQAKTEEELGNECLSVALEITGSQFGFINELGADGMLHDVAKSELAWEQCLLYDKTGHRRPPSDFIVYGLYGSVVVNEKSFFTNNPKSHPDSIGLPPGHPPLKSFLGVPLIQNGKTIGLIAVANRENGYTCEQLEDLEGIAPAVTQVLQRKREEQERMKTEEALRRERSLLESVMKTTDVMLALLDPQFNFVWVNPAYAETCKLKPEEIVGKNHFSIYPDAENEAIFRTVRDTGKGVFYKDKPFVFQDQPERGVTYWDWNLAPVKNASGDVEGLVFSLRETTKYKKAEEALHLSEEKFAKAFYGNAAGMIITRAKDGTIIDANERWLRDTGYSRDEVICRSINDDLHIWMDIEKWNQMVCDLRKSRSIYGVEMEYINKNGTRRVALLSLQRMMLEGEEAILSSSLDITKQKEAEEALRKSEEHFRLLIEQAPVAIAIDRHGLIDYANSRYLEMFRIDSLDDIRGQPFLEVFASHERMRAKEEWNRIHLGLPEPSENEFVGMRRDGTQFPFYIATSRIELDGESVNIVFLTDITERRQAERQLSNELARATGLYELYTLSSNLSDRELYDFALNQAVKITDSVIGFFHLVSEDEKEIILTTWNKEALRSCTAGNEGHYPIEKAGNWVDCVRLKQPVVYNDFPSSPNQKGLPVGHSVVKRFMSVPVTENGKVRIIFGVGNKVDEYNDRDVMQLQLVANELHKIMKLRRIENEIRESEAFLRDIMENASDAIFVRDKESRMILANTAYYRLMGKSPEKVLNKTVADFNSPELSKKLAEDDRLVLETGKGTTLEKRILTSHGWRILQTVKAPYYDGQGNIIGLIGVARDITERKEAEEALKKAHDNLEKLVKERTAELEKAYNSLKESERGLAEAQKMAHIGNWDWNFLTGEVYWSDELYHIFGRSPQESGATYDELLNYVNPEDRDYMANAIKKASYEKPHGIDYRIVRADGEERTVHAQSEVFFDEKNTPVRAKGIVQDVTERKKSEEKIQNLASIVESSNDAIGTMSLDGVITSWNKGAEQVFGYSAKEILGKTGSVLAPPHLSEEIKRLTERAKKGEKVLNYETSRLRKDGAIINVSVTFSPVFDASGKLTAISVISRDITERKRAEEKLRESEEKYRNIVETANEGILIIDDEAKITYINKKMADMLGYTLEEGMSRPVWDFADKEGKTILKQKLEKRRQGINESYELKLICKDGSPLWVLINAKSLFDRDGKFMGVMSMLTDITERKMAEEALERIDKVRIKEIHHRIKNNLQIISSLLDLQAEKFEDENVIEAFREGQNRVSSMSLIHEELYKGEGNDTLDFSAYLEKLAENLFKTYNLSNKNIHLKMDLEEETFLDMDTAIPLGIIVNELVSNSLKHAFPDREKGEIRIKLYREEKNLEMNMSLFSLTISDDGKGLPEDLELESAGSLGLQLVNILVDQLDGELALKRNNGTEFTINFTITDKK